MRPRYEKVPFRPSAQLFFYVREESHYPFDLHFHPEFELTWIESGHGTRAVGQTLEAYTAGDLILVGPDLPHTWASGEEGLHRAHVLQFGAGVLAEGFLDLPENAPLRRLFDASKHGLAVGGATRGKVITSLRKFPESDVFGHHALLYAILGDLSAGVWEDARALCADPLIISAEEGSRFSRLVRWMQENLEGEVSLEGAARAVNMSPRSFTRFVKRTTGKTLVELTNELRVHTACRLLAESDRAIGEICFASGFQNLSHFNQQFRRLRGVTPREFRRTLRAQSPRKFRQGGPSPAETPRYR